jgi:release factor glutamine methyltransferase
MSGTVGSALRRAAGALAAAGIDNPGREARLLLAHALGVGAEALLDRTRPLPDSGFESMLARRCAREPLALIVGRQGFWTLDLEVSAATLIPRADSETLIEAACASFPDRAAVRSVLDLGTGTGALLLAALVEFPTAWGVGVDLIPAAAALAARNARRNGLERRAMLVCGDWVAPLAGRFDLILSNPPYIPSGSIAGLMPEVARHEPRQALDGGADGLCSYRVLLALLSARLSEAGVAIVELGAGQANDVALLARAAGFRGIRVCRDLATIERALVLQSREV